MEYYSKLSSFKHFCGILFVVCVVGKLLVYTVTVATCGVPTAHVSFSKQFLSITR